MDRAAQSKVVHPVLPRLRIGIAIGDVTGVGPEVTLKALHAEADKGDTDFLIIGDAPRLRRLNRELGINLALEAPECDHTSRFRLLDPLETPLPPHLAPGAPEAAQAALAYLRAGADGCLRGELAALVTAPVNKEAIIRSGEPDFTGQTEFLSAL